MLLLLLEKAWQSLHPRLLLSLTTGWSLLSCWFKVRRSYTAFPNGLSLFWFCVFLGPSWSFPLFWVCWELAEKDKALCVPLIFLTPTSKTQAHTCTESNKIPVKLGNRKKKKNRWYFLELPSPSYCSRAFSTQTHWLKQKNSLKTKEKGRVLVWTWKTKFKNNSYPHIFLQTWCKHYPVKELLTPITWFLVL